MEVRGYVIIPAITFIVVEGCVVLKVVLYKTTEDVQQNGKYDGFE